MYNIFDSLEYEYENRRYFCPIVAFEEFEMVPREGQKCMTVAEESAIAAADARHSMMSLSSSRASYLSLDCQDMLRK
ncbi:hypothetical protein AA105894_2364 [Asaia spathodeae NBRC 105894]|nr:hypothetical protein AA105894_2364 [Asaia spathodeae NBRC 105894]